MQPNGTLEGLSNEAIFWLSIYTFLLGGFIVLLIILFALALLFARRWPLRKGQLPLDMALHELLHVSQGPSRRDATSLGTLAAAAYAEHLLRRNEFWTTYGQVTVAVLLLIVVAVLLLTKTIEPDAGLPILSGIAGFAIAKGTGTSGGTVKLPDRNANE